LLLSIHHFNTTYYFVYCKYTVFQKKEATKLLAMTFSNLNWFSKFFHCWKEDEMSNKNHAIFSTTPYICSRTTLGSLGNL